VEDIAIRDKDSAASSIALFLDRDGVININYGYVHSTDKFTLVEGVVELIRAANRLNYRVIVVTNQSGIARGYYTEQEFLAFNEWMINHLKQQNAQIDRVYYCPHHPENGLNEYKIKCECRKPGIDMALQAKTEYHLDLSQSIMVGDRCSDIEFAINAKFKLAYYLNADVALSEIDSSNQTQVQKITSLSQITL
jgi:D-glycero-D-manno-heptose 1,7-bisphosphate phosphatase